MGTEAWFATRWAVGVIAAAFIYGLFVLARAAATDPDVRFAIALFVGLLVTLPLFGELVIQAVDRIGRWGTKAHVSETPDEDPRDDPNP